MVQEADKPFVAHRVEESGDIDIEYVVHLGAGDAAQSIQRIVLAAPGSEPVREPEEILLVDCVQYHDHGTL